eukprot:GHVU01095731.1.p2 GENE.GHVU01095731.1~~GHVU01095731.1.p2  ORF type:complete len:125 (+),score=28.15 GHVU01095731.1:100-474(+)
MIDRQIEARLQTNLSRIETGVSEDVFELTPFHLGEGGDDNDGAAEDEVTIGTGGGYSDKSANTAAATIHILTPNEPLRAANEERLMLLLSMASSPSSRRFEDKIRQWERAVSTTLETLATWLQV